MGNPEKETLLPKSEDRKSSIGLSEYGSNVGSSVKVESTANSGSNRWSGGDDYYDRCGSVNLNAKKLRAALAALPPIDDFEKDDVPPLLPKSKDRKSSIGLPKYGSNVGSSKVESTANSGSNRWSGGDESYNMGGSVNPNAKKLKAALAALPPLDDFEADYVTPLLPKSKDRKSSRSDGGSVNPMRKN